MSLDLHLLSGPDKYRFKSFVENDFYMHDELSVREYVNASIVPGPVGAVIYNEKYVIGSMSYSVRCPQKFRIVPTSSEVVDSDEEVLFLGSFESCWGHCITDNLKHLWVLLSPIIEKYRTIKWVYTLEMPENGLPNNFVDLLMALGLPMVRLTLVDRPTRFRKVYLPDSCFYCDAESPEHYRYYTKEFKSLIDQLIDSVDSNRAKRPTRKVYLTRSGWKKGNPDFGEKCVEAAFSHKGFEIVHPEDLSFSETVKLMGECETMAATEGSTAHNSIFLQNGANLVVLRKANYINEYQPPINQMRVLNVTYIDANMTKFLASSRCPFCGPFFLCCNDALAEYTGAKQRFPFFEYLKYIHRCFACKGEVIGKRVIRFVKRKLGM